MSSTVQAAGPLTAREAETPFASYIDVLVAQRWLILFVVCLVTFIGVCYATLRAPVFQTDIIVQVEEENPGATAGYLADVSSIFDIKPAASGEMEVLRSRAVLTSAVQTHGLNVEASPRYLPLVGRWLSTRKDVVRVGGKTNGYGYVWGRESISVGRLEVPPVLVGEQLYVDGRGNDRYFLVDPAAEKRYPGTVGVTERFDTGSGVITMRVDQLVGEPGARFKVRRISDLQAVEALQASMGIFERGRQSGVIGATLRGADPVLIASVLNEVGRSYVKQNVERKALQARSSLAFLEEQLPQIKQQLETSETRYSALRNRRGTVNLSEEGKLVLAQSVETQNKIFDLKARRQELATRFVPTNPAIVAIDRQIASLSADAGGLSNRIRGLPDLEQDVIRLERDVTVNTALYTTLLNNTQQLRLVSAGKVGNVRMVDTAVVPEDPLPPTPSTIIAIALAAGVVLSLVAALIRNALFGGMTTPVEVERFTGLPVLSAIPFSEKKDKWWRRYTSKSDGGLPMSIQMTEDRDVVAESLRALRTALDVQLGGRQKTIVAITGPVSGVGKSFLSANFAMVQAAIGKRVLLIDADFRRGRLNRYFGADDANGLAEYLQGRLSYDDVIKKDLPSGVDLVSAGKTRDSTSELLALPAFGQFLQRVAEDYDMVIVDTPPVLLSGEASRVASYADATLVVVRSGINTVGEVEETAKRLAQAGARVDGVLFNGFKLMPERYGFRPKYGHYRYTHSSYYLPNS